MKPDSIILVDKPKGVTSFDVIRTLRNKLGVKKLGHAGTLDPMATGLLIIGVEEGTKRLHDLVGLSKVYEAEILLGVRTDTGDVTGKILEEKSVPDYSDKDIEKVLKDSLGKLILTVSAYSAMKRKGKPLYEYAREGKDIILPKREMEIISIEFKGYSKEDKTLKVKIEVSSGTYVRSLAEEWGRRLENVATLKELRRVSVGSYLVDDAKKLEDF